MKMQRVASIVLAAGAALFAGVSARADQPGQAAMPSPSARVGGARMALPSPRTLGRGTTLLNRGGTLLPPSPVRPSRPDMGWGQRPVPLPTPLPGNGGIDDGVSFPSSGEPFPAGGQGPRYYDRVEGTSISGSVNNDRFRLRWHIGAGCNRWSNCVPKFCRPPLRPCFPTWGWSNWGWNWWNTSAPQFVFSGPWFGNDPFVTSGTVSASTPAAAAAVAAPAEKPRELTQIELADLAWQGQNLADAARYLKEYLAGAPDDADAMRFLALVMIDQRKLDEGVALMAMAYERMPQLASRPLPARDIPGGLAQMRRRVQTMSGYANRVRTGSAWLTLSVLVQGEGRDGVARGLVERAQRAGLSESLATEMRSALGN